MQHGTHIAELDTPSEINVDKAITEHLETIATSIISEFAKYPDKTEGVRSENEIRDAIMMNKERLNNRYEQMLQDLPGEVDRVVGDGELDIEGAIYSVIDAPFDEYIKDMEEHANQVAFRLGWSDTVEKDDVSIDELIASATGDASHDVFYDNALKYHTIHTVKDTADGDFFPAYLRYPRYEHMPHIAFNELIKLYPYEPLVADEHVGFHESIGAREYELPPVIADATEGY